MVTKEVRMATLPSTTKPETGTIKGTVIDVGLGKDTKTPVVGAEVILKAVKPAVEGYPCSAVTDKDGSYIAHLSPGSYQVSCASFLPKADSKNAEVGAGKEKEVNFAIKVGLKLTALDREEHECTQLMAGNPVTFRADYHVETGAKETKLSGPRIAGNSCRTRESRMRFSSSPRACLGKST
jgi:hypothetical protein